MIAAAEPDDASSVIEAAIAATSNTAEEEALPLLEAAVARHPSNASLWQLLALAHRNLEQLKPAIEAAACADALKPEDPLIAHTLARCHLEAGLAAVDLFDRAHGLAPLDASVLLGRAAAYLAEGRIDEAVSELEVQLRQHPAWLDGYTTLTRLRWLRGEKSSFTDGLEAALGDMPGEGVLWRELVTALINAEMFDDALAALRRAREAVGASMILDVLEASIHSETGDIEAADRLFDSLPPLQRMPMIVRYVRHLLAAGRPDQAAELAETYVGDDEADQVWPYLATAWRLTGDSRWKWLEGDPRFIGVYDLSESLGSLDALAERLRALHRLSGQPLEQSLRGGTQTDGPLLARIEPEIERLRSAIMDAVRDHVAQLPDPDPNHPLLRYAHEPLRLSGSWSVRLTDGGRHIDHVHPAGWLSSALYVALPESEMGGEDHAGWLTLGEAKGVADGLAPIRMIEPKAGQLVLFPSTMWHGTRPFAAGERLTVAFDVARPPR